MAQHDITALVARIQAAGGTRDQLLALDNVQAVGDQVIAWNVKAEAAAYQLAEQIEARAATVARAEAMFTAISAGQCVFTKSREGWLIAGPDATIQPGATVTVTKADDTTKTVRIAHVAGRFEKRGLAYATATFTDATPHQRSPRGRTSGRCAECNRYSSTLTTVFDGSGIPGACCPRCARMDQVERSFA